MTRKKQNFEIMTGLDIGSSAIRIAVGQYDLMDSNICPQIIGTIEVPSEGVHKGVINSIEECVSSISNGLEQIERSLGIPINNFWVGMSGTQINVEVSKGIIAIAKTDGEIEEDDVDRAVEHAKTVTPPLNYEVLHAIPMSFVVDGQAGIKDPLGMTGVRLEADARIFYALSSNIRNIEKAVHRTGIDIEDIVLSMLATGQAVTTSRQRKLGVVVVNIGASTTSIVVYEEGDIIHTTVLPVGSEHVTNDIAIGLKSGIDIAERVKLFYGECMADNIPKNEKIDLLNCGAEVNQDVSKKFVSEIICARMSEILAKVNRELITIQRAGVLPAGVVYTGGGSKIDGLVELSKEVLNLPSSLGYPVDVDGTSDKVNDLSFSTAIGLVKWGMMMRESQVVRRPAMFTGAGKVVQKVQKLFKSLIP